MKSGKIITRVCDFLNDPYDTNGISRDQLWVDRGGTVYFELRYGEPPLESTGCKSELTLSAVQKLNEAAQRIHDQISHVVAAEREERTTPYRVIMERKALPRISV